MNIIVKRLKQMADAGAPRYVKSARNDYLKITKNLDSFMDIYKDKYIDIYEQTHDKSKLEEELSSDINEEIAAEAYRFDTAFVDYIYCGDLASVIYDEIEENGKDHNDDNVLIKHIEKVLEPYTSLGEYIVDHGPTADSDKNIHDAVEEFIEENF